MKYLDLNNLFPKKKLACLEDEIFDIAVIGAGVVGCAIFKEFCENGAKTVLVEKANDILEGASKGNSAILHTGFDAPPGTLEHECVQRGYQEYMKIKDEFNLPFSNTKALVVAWNDEQLAKLDAILQKGLGNGVKELEILSHEQILKREPNLSSDAKGAILVHGESLIDPWSAPLAYLKKGISCGGKTAFSHEVKNGHYNGKYWELQTSQKPIKAKVIINAAGLYSDIVDAILQKGLGNGVKELEILSHEQTVKREPNLSSDAKGAILVHGESLIDPWSAPLAYLKKGISCGGKTAFSHEVKDGHYNGKYWELQTSQKPIKAKVVINAAGLYSDIVDAIKGTKDFKIIPRKGQFVIFDETAYNLINSIILPVPTKRTKGVVITKTAFGNILVGPTAEDQESRTNSDTVKETLEELKDKAFHMLPALKNHKVTATFAGLRPASDETYYRVGINDEKNWITVGGIRSTGLTSSLGLAKYIFELNDTKYEKNPKSDTKVSVTNISEFAPREYQKEGYGKIVCHCECVTEKEIKDACHGQSGAGNIGGLLLHHPNTSTFSDLILFHIEAKLCRAN